MVRMNILNFLNITMGPDTNNNNIDGFSLWMYEGFLVVCSLVCVCVFAKAKMFLNFFSIPATGKLQHGYCKYRSSVDFL